MSKTITKVIAGIGIVAGIGVAALPLSSYAADVAVSFVVKPTLAAAPTICASAAAAAAASNTVTTVDCTVGYSANGGASVSIKGKDAVLTLVSGSNSIPVVTGTPASLTAGTPAWGYKFIATTPGAGTGGLTATITNYAAITAADVTVGSNTAPVTSALGTFTFAAATAITTPAGTYTDTVTISVTPAAS
ncbi:MAG: hypothetical protein ACK5MU_01275 [Candidatus Saccharimonadales bacterium]